MSGAGWLIHNEASSLIQSQLNIKGTYFIGIMTIIISKISNKKDVVAYFLRFSTETECSEFPPYRFPQPSRITFEITHSHVFHGIYHSLHIFT